MADELAHDARSESSTQSTDSEPLRSTREVVELLHHAVEALGGSKRPGQVRMAEEVADAIAEDRHLLVQAGTGTGKSLAYLVPAFEYATRTDTAVVVATATLALQSQLVGRDLPDLVRAIGKRLRRKPSYAMLKGRHNYACLYRVNDGVPDDQGVLVEVRPSSAYGRQVLALRKWAEDQMRRNGAGDRDDAPTHTDRAWSQVSVSSAECVGDRCAYRAECFAERARTRAAAADVVVTNHALLAIEALDGQVQVLPDHGPVIVDEAHELAARATSVASEALSPQLIERTVRRCAKYCKDELIEQVQTAGAALKAALAGQPAARLERLPSALREAVELVRDAARAVVSALPKSDPGSEPALDFADGLDRPGGGGTASDGQAGLRIAQSVAEQTFDAAARIAGESPHDVVWIADRETAGPELEVAPLSVAGLLRGGLFEETTCVLTSATLQLGGKFDAAARSVGLRAVDRVPGRTADGADAGDASADADASAGAGSAAGGATGEHGRAEPEEPGGAGVVEPLPWTGLDVGSPFDYRRQAILYIAGRLPPPGRGISEAALNELCRLVEALGGRTLGLFSSRRAAEDATAAVRERVGTEVLCQGEAQLPELSRRFVAEPATSLFGTLSLWQGIDVPGTACQLVVIDRLPFPRPDDPLMSARQQAVDAAGGNGFMAVAATHAALLLAQGVGRLIRRSSDRGVVAVLDSRLSTKRYSSFLRASLPPMWPTTDPDVVAGALRRLRESA